MDWGKTRASKIAWKKRDLQEIFVGESRRLQIKGVKKVLNKEEITVSKCTAE